MTQGKEYPKWMLVGLGNPGSEYEHTYHNAGSLFLEYFKTTEAPHERWRKESQFRSLQFGPIILVIPHTYMNVSGTAVREALRTYRVTPENLVLAHDDADLFLETYRLQFGRGSAGHHGVESVIAALRTKAFFRLRIGTRRNETSDKRSSAAEAMAGKQATRSGRERAGDFALRRFTKLHEKKLYGAFSGMREGILKLIQNETS